MLLLWLRIAVITTDCWRSASRYSFALKKLSIISFTLISTICSCFSNRVRSSSGNITFNCCRYNHYQQLCWPNMLIFHIYIERYTVLQYSGANELVKHWKPDIKKVLLICDFSVQIRIRHAGINLDFNPQCIYTTISWVTVIVIFVPPVAQVVEIHIATW